MCLGEHMSRKGFLWYISVRLEDGMHMWRGRQGKHVGAGVHESGIRVILEIIWSLGLTLCSPDRTEKSLGVGQTLVKDPDLHLFLPRVTSFPSGPGLLQGRNLLSLLPSQGVIPSCSLGSWKESPSCVLICVPYILIWIRPYWPLRSYLHLSPQRHLSLVANRLFLFLKKKTYPGYFIHVLSSHWNLPALWNTKMVFVVFSL